MDFASRNILEVKEHIVGRTQLEADKMSGRHQYLTRFQDKLRRMEELDSVYINEG